MKKRIQKILAFLLVVMLVVQGSVNLNASEPAVEETTEITVEATDQVEKQAEKEKEKATTEADKDETQTTTEAQKEEEKATTEEAEEQTSAEEVTTETQKEEKAAEAATQATTEATVSEEETTVTEPTTEAAAEATTEAKAEPKTAFSYEDNRVIITAIAKKEANFPENTELKARYIKKGSDEYNTAVNTIKEQTEIDDEQFLDFVCYDVYFEVDGKEVEPEAGMVKVTIKYKNPIFQGVADEATNYITYHINDNNVVEDVTESISTNDSGAVSSVSFKTGEFSPIVTTAILTVYEVDTSNNVLLYKDYGLLDPTFVDEQNPELENFSTTLFKITTKDADGNIVTDNQIAYCLESLHKTPHGVEINNPEGYDDDDIKSIKNNNDLQKILYYGYGGPGDISDGFFTYENLSKYIGTGEGKIEEDTLNNIFTALVPNPYYDPSQPESADNPKTLSKLDCFKYIVTHIAASIAYIAVGDRTEIQYDPVKWGGYGANQFGKKLAAEWTEYIKQKTVSPALTLTLDGMKVTADSKTILNLADSGATGKTFSLTSAGDTDQGITFTVPDGMNCTIDSGTKYDEGERVTIKPGQSFSFSVVHKVSDSKDTLRTNWDSGELAINEENLWSVVFVKRNYNQEPDQGGGQDIGAVSFTRRNEEVIQFRLMLPCGKISLKKIDSKTKEELSGATFGIYSDKGCTNEIGTIEAGKEKYITYSGDDKTVYLKEIVAPKGYKLSDNVYTVVLDEEKTAVVTVADDSLSVKVNKTDITGEKEVAGATISIHEINEDGNLGEVVAEWTSDGNGPYDFGSELEAGKTYRLVETVAPDGYAYTESITFTVNSDGTVNVNRDNVSDNTILMKDDLTFLSVNKVDKNGAPVAGAKLVIRDADGIPVTDILTSGKEAIVVRGLAAGKYILSEIESPDGYSVSADVWFEVSDKYDPEHKINTVTMTDEEENNAAKGKVTVTKTLSLGDKDLPIGAKDTVFYVALFSDAERTQRVSDVKPLIFKNQSTTTAVFEKLEAGIYYVGETDAYGNLIDANAEDALFIPQYIDGYVAEITSTVFEVSKSINNRFPTLPEGYYYEGTLNITKKVLKGTEAWATDNVYYAGVFTDAACTQKATDPIKLAMNGSSETTAKVTVPLGEDPKTVVTYYVAETDENGVVLQNGNSIPFTISIDGSKAELSGEYNTKNVTITNTYDADGYYNEEDSDTDTNEKSESSKSTKSKKTGDNTQIMLYIMLFAAALLGCMGVTLRRKGRHSR